MSFGIVTAMTQKPRDLLIAWSLLPFLSPNRVRLLLECFNPITDATRAPAGFLTGLLKIDRDQAQMIRRPTARVGPLRDSTITLLDKDYPRLLREIIDPPLVLHVRGKRELLARDSIAVVGSRRASPYAINAAKAIAGPLAFDAKLVIVSGLARGIDAAGHEAALDAGGTTIAVLGTGIDVVYPGRNADLSSQIAGSGLLVSEFPLGTDAIAHNFVTHRI